MNQYHGWIIVERSARFKDVFYAEWRDANGDRHLTERWTSPAQVIEFWDNRLGGNYGKVYLEPTPLSAYRVYTKGKDPA